jgi:hypothetical protein
MPVGLTIGAIGGSLIPSTPQDGPGTLAGILMVISLVLLIIRLIWLVLKGY